MTRLFRVFVLAAALLGLSAPTTASADFGSGTLGDWSKYSHGIVGDPATADVWVVGDSITNRCWPQLKTRLAAKGKTLAVDAWSSRPTQPAVDLVLARLQAGQRIPPILIMASGSNDIFSPPAMSAQVARLKKAVPDVRWVDVHVARWGTSYDTAKQVSDMRNSGWVNGSIRAHIPDAQVIPWSVQVAAIPGRGVSLARYLQDGVHPWPSAKDGHSDGCALWAYTIAGRVQ